MLKRKRKSNRLWKSIVKNYDMYLMSLPVVIYFIIFMYWPMYGVQIAFKDYNAMAGIWGSPWVGFKHLDRFFNAYYFWRLIKNTVGISGYSILVGIPAPIILALLFNEIRNTKVRTVTQALSYAPHFISVVVVCGLIIMMFSPDSGLFPAIIRLFGGEVDTSILANPKAFWNIYVWSGIWQGIGWGSIIYTAAISGIPNEQYEAATIDGATKVKQIWHVTLPNLLPTIVILSIMSIGNIMNVGYEKIYLLQNPINLETSEVISTYVYKSGLQNAQYSFSSMIGLFNNVINFAILVAINAIARRINETSLW